MLVSLLHLLYRLSIIQQPLSINTIECSNTDTQTLFLLLLFPCIQLLSNASVLSPISQWLHFSPTLSLRHSHPGFSSLHVFIFNAPSFPHFHLRSIYLPFSLSHTHCNSLSISIPPLYPISTPHHQPPSLNIVPLKHSCVVSSSNTARQKSVISHLSSGG